MANMSKFFVALTIGGKNYITSVVCTSNFAAEHLFLDRGIVTGQFGYGCDHACSFDESSIDTDTFRGELISCSFVSCDEAFALIDKRNEELEAKQNAADLIWRINKQIKELQKQIEIAKKILEE